MHNLDSYIFGLCIYNQPVFTYAARKVGENANWMKRILLIAVITKHRFKYFRVWFETCNADSTIPLPWRKSIWCLFGTLRYVFLSDNLIQGVCVFIFLFLSSEVTFPCEYCLKALIYDFYHIFIFTFIAIHSKFPYSLSVFFFFFFSLLLIYL